MFAIAGLFVSFGEGVCSTASNDTLVTVTIERMTGEARAFLLPPSSPYRLEIDHPHCCHDQAEQTAQEVEKPTSLQDAIFHIDITKDGSERANIPKVLRFSIDINSFFSETDLSVGL